MRAVLLLGALAACEHAGAITGEVVLGDEAFTPKRCVDAARAYGLPPGSLAFEADPGGLFVTPAPDALVTYYPPFRGGEALIVSADHCAKLALSDGHLVLRCNDLRADLRFGECP